MLLPRENKEKTKWSCKTNTQKQMELTCNNDVNCRKFFFHQLLNRSKLFFFNHPHKKFLVEKIKCKKKRKKTLSGGVAQHTTEQNYCSSTDSREQTICLRYSLWGYSKLTASHPSITAPSQYHSRTQKYLLKGEEQIFIFYFLFTMCTLEKARGRRVKEIGTQTNLDGFCAVN